MTIQHIKKRKQDCDIKSQFWFSNKGVKLNICEYISFFGDKLLAQKLAKVINNYLSL